MTVQEWLQWGRLRLQLSECDSPLLDTSLLLSHVLQWPREKLILENRTEVDGISAKQYQALILQRAKGFPVAYLTGHKEFYGLDFSVREGVLCPRPDTEILVEEALSLLSDYPNAPVLDLCTGTGCVALSLLSTRADLKMTASDISPFAEEIFQENNQNLCGGMAEFIRSDLFGSISGIFQIIVTNPPYLTRDESRERMEEGWKEPEIALDGGDDGLFYIRKIIKLSKDHLLPGGWLMMESTPPLMDSMEFLFREAGYLSIQRIKDLPGLERVMIGRQS